MANNRMFLCHRPGGLAVFLGKRMQDGWYAVPDDLADRVRELFQLIEFEDGSQDDFCVALENADSAPAAREYNMMDHGPTERTITLSPIFERKGASND